MKYFVVFFIAFIWIQSYTAQQYSFSNFSEQKGLTKNTVLSINQLENGEIWLGTHYGGIDILDGYEIENRNKNNGLVDNVVYDIVKLQKEKYLLTTNKGISIYSHHRFRTIPFKDSLANTRIFTGFKANDGSVWLATGKGIATVKNDTILPYISSDTLLNQSSIIHIREDINGSIWCATMGNNVFELTKDKKVIRYALNDNLEYTFFTFQKTRTVTWLLSYKGIFALENGTINKVNFNCTNHLNGVYYHSCIEDSRGNIWIATNKGVIKIDGKGNQILLTEKNGLEGHEAWKIFEDRENNIWITFKKNGVSKLASQFFTLFNDGFENVTSIYIDTKDSLWLGTNKGVFNYRKDTLLHLVYKNDLTLDKFNAIHGIAKQKENYFFVCEQGVNLWDKNSYVNYDFIGENRFAGECIYTDKDKVYLGSSVQGVATFRNNKIQLINDSLGLKPMGVFSILKTADDNWWFATEEGLYQHNGTALQKMTQEENLPTVKTRCLLDDKDKTLWVGNSEGVFYKKGGDFFPIYKNDTLHNNSVYSMCFDLENNLWVGKIDGLDKITFVGDSITIKKYNTTRGLNIGALHNNAMVVDANNNILVGTDKGLLKYNPAEDYPNLVESRTIISNIMLFSQPTNWNLFTDSLDENRLPVNLTLNYNQNYFTFQYVGICHKYPEGVRYKTKLEGLDKEWVNRGKKRFVIYGNLKPGKYTFLLKSCNSEGIWNKTPVRFSFTINPPFWETGWFYSICGFIILGWVYSYVKIRRANKLITDKNEHITLINKEVEEKNHEIMDSINYAKRIQDSMLPDSKLNYLIPKSFIYFQPKDVVSGDFYWFKRVESKFLIAAVDCTGHGVPGAFVSMIGFSGLNRAVNEYKLTAPHSILEKLSDFVVESFAKHESKSINDGMDASLCTIDTISNVLQYAGANNSMYIIRNSGNPILTPNGETVATKNLGILSEIKATRRPIGKSDKPIPFANHLVQLEKGDRIYLFTDGFPDQFGGDKGKKYMYKAFKRFLVSIQDLPIEKQGLELEKEFKIWTIGKVEQVDDICILGIEI